MTQPEHAPPLPDLPATAVGFLENLVGTEVTFRLAGSQLGAWGPYTLLAVYPTGPLPALLVKGSREYLVPLSQLSVIHQGAKPAKPAKTYGNEFHEHVAPVPGLPGITIEEPETGL